MTRQLAKPEDIGRAKRVDGDIYRYIEQAKRTLPRDVTLTGLRIAIDCANGAAYKVAPSALWELGAEVVPIGTEPNGVNINLECGSTHPAALQKKVHEVRADIGIALDGDADRVLIIDEEGQVIDGDQLMRESRRTPMPAYSRQPRVKRLRRRLVRHPARRRSLRSPSPTAKRCSSTKKG